MPVWSKGDECMAPYNNDGKLYRGKILSIRRDIHGIKARVKYSGYGSDCDEIPVTDLKQVSREKTLHTHEGGKKPTGVISITDSEEESLDTSLFKPLRQEDLQLQLEQKYSVLDDENDERKSTTLVTKETKKSKVKSVVVTGGQDIPRTPVHRKTVKRTGSLDKTTSPRCSSTADTKKDGIVKLDKEDSMRENDIVKITDTINRDGDEEHPDSLSSDGEGFSEEDLEKPKFSFPAVGSKVPYVLSPDTEQPVIQVPATMNRYLRDYQREGIKFLYNNYRAGKGAILGDDMGLGKTVQVIGFMLAVLGKQGNRLDVLKHRPKFIREMSDSSKALSALDRYPTQPFLIIGPGSVLYNWLDELETWGYFNVGKYHGAEKTECLRDIKKNKYDVILTTYETFRDNVEELISVYWLAVIADEVHRIKGVKAQTTVALRKLKTNYRYGLTGTALQNNMAEIWSLLDWVQPGCLGSLATFKEEYVIPIEHGQKNDSTKRELAEARKLKEKFSKLRNKMMLRRTKRLIADQLPVKDDNVVFCKLSELQVSVYEMILDQPGIRFVMLADEPCACGSDQLQKYCCTESPDGESMKALKFIFMHLLLKTANHVALLLPSTDSNQSEYSKRICRSVCQKFPEFFDHTKESAFRTLSDPKYCGKMKILRGLLEVFYSDHSKVLVFSYSTKVLDIIEQYMMTTGYEYRRLDGSTSMKQRMVLVREFNSDPNIFVFLISTNGQVKNLPNPLK